MMGKDMDEIERSLAQFIPRSAPPDLGRRVVARALDSRMNAAVTPRMRAMAVLCFVLTTVVMTGDALFSKWQSGRIGVLRGGPGVSEPGGEEADLLWAEVGGDLGDLDKFRKEGLVFSRLGSLGGSSRAYLEARDLLKGTIDHEDPESYY